MKNCHVYILYSESRDRYYIGYTCDEIESRVSKHNSKHKGYTGSVNDWRLVYYEIHRSKEEAIQRERKIKSWKSRVKIEGLIKEWRN